MLQESQISKHSPPRSHRTYAPEFKAELVAACQQPGVSIAALALQHGMNANVLHRWLKEHLRSARHCLVAQRAANAPELAAFIALPLSGPPAMDNDQSLRIELRKGALTMVVTWPMRAVADFAGWTTAVLK